MADIAWCIGISAAIAAVVAVARPLGGRLARWGAGHPVALIAGGGLAVGLLAIAFRAIADRPVDLVLFSGQTTLPATVAETSAGVLALAVALKAVAFVLSMGAGFRGGPIFPCVAVGAGAGAFMALALPGLATTPAVIAGIAASAAAGMRLPIFGAVLAALLVGGDISETLPIAVLASVIGWLTSLAADRLLERRRALAARPEAPPL